MYNTSSADRVYITFYRVYIAHGEGVYYVGQDVYHTGEDVYYFLQDVYHISPQWENSAYVATAKNPLTIGTGAD